MEASLQFPIKVIFHEDNEEWLLYNEMEIAYNLEWFNSKDPEENATVTDKEGRVVHLVVKELKVIVCELAKQGIGTKSSDAPIVRATF